MTVQFRSRGTDRIRLTGERHFFPLDRTQGERSRAISINRMRRSILHTAWTERSEVNPAYRGAATFPPRTERRASTSEQISISRMRRSILHTAWIERSEIKARRVARSDKL